MRHSLIAFFCALIMITPAFAVDPDEVLDDPVLEERAREISKGLRCVVCMNQSIDESDAMPARDLRLLIRERLQEGDTDEQVVEYVVSRYGEYVLLQPRFSTKNMFLWFSPLVVLFGGILLAVWFVRSQKKVTVEVPAPLSDEEQKALDEMMGERPDDK